jgi:hypothetical protein
MFSEEEMEKGKNWKLIQICVKLSNDGELLNNINSLGIYNA